MRCAEARALLQQRHDAGEPPGEDLAAHLAGCARCSAFARFLAGLGASVREALESAAAGLPRPDYAEIFVRAAEERETSAFRTRRSRLTLAAAAAVLVAGVGIAAGASAWIGHRDRLMVTSNVNGFVDDLFAEPLLADAGAALGEEGFGLRTWLEGTDAPYLP